MNPIPKLTDAESALLRESIRRDGVQYPILLDSSGAVIDGHHRKQLAAELGKDCPTRTLDVDAETAERLAVTLNLARRQLDAAARYDLIGWLAERHEADAKAAAQQRKIEGNARGGHGSPASPRSTTSITAATTDIAGRINADLAAAGEPTRVSRSKVERAQRWKRASEADKAAVRAGQKTVTDVVSPGHKNWAKPSKTAAKRTSKREPARQIHSREQLDSLARIRAMNAELQYESMLNAPPGRINNPFMERAHQIQTLLDDLFEMPPERAVTFVPAQELPRFSTSRGQWWLEFAERCEKRWHDEVPELPAWRTVRVIPLAERDLTRGDLAMLEWLRTKTEPVTIIEAAVALRIGESTAAKALKALADADLAEVAGVVDKRLAYRAHR